MAESTSRTLLLNGQTGSALWPKSEAVSRPFLCVLSSCCFHIVNAVVMPSAFQAGELRIDNAIFD